MRVAAALRTLENVARLVVKRVNQSLACHSHTSHLTENKIRTQSVQRQVVSMQMPQMFNSNRLPHMSDSELVQAYVEVNTGLPTANSATYRPPLPSRSEEHTSELQSH